MARGEADLLKQVLEKLMYLDPPIKKFPVTPEDPAMAVYFLDLKDVCYITTKSDQGREETMFMTSGGKAYYSNLRLTEIEKRLAEHPHFMRTSKFYVINLTKVRGLEVSSARNLWFDGIKEKVTNAVTSTYLADFEKKAAMSELLKRVENIFLKEKSLIGKDGTFVPVKDVLYLTSKRGDVLAILAGKKPITLPGNLNTWEELLRGLFIQTHRQYLVALDRIEGTFEKFPEEPEEEKRLTREELRAKDDECEISLRGTAKRIPVTAVYGKKLKKTLGITRFHYLAPENPSDRALRLYGLIDFGWRELYGLEKRDKAAVEVFKAKWDIKQFDKKRMLSYFRLFGVNEINTKRVIKNLIYQMWRWIQKGIEDKSDGNIRSLWYKIKSVLAQHSNIFGSGDVDTFYSTLQEMVEEQELFRYKDFGFMDMNEPYRWIGKKNPEIILASEKLGHYLFIKKLADEQGVSFICLKGEPAVISMEYFSDDLKEKCGGKPLTVFSISDVDPAGYSIERNLLRGLEKVHQINKVVKLVDVSAFTTEEIGFVRFPVVSYEKKGDQVKPITPATMGQVTKGRAWYDEEIKDERLLTEKDKGGGWKVFTIHGIESDAADREVIKARFLAGLGRLRRKPGKKR